MPRIHMTRSARIALYFLRIYLILLLGLIIVRFILLFAKPSSNSRPTSSAIRSTSLCREPAADPQS